MTFKPNKTLAFCALLIAFTIGFKAEQAVAQPGEEVTYQTFYDELSPYGQWIEDANYGYVWLPNVEPEFRPYATDGHWVETEYGNTWYSEYDWGWAAFHYGRWRFDDRHGWEWIPGTEWGPAWVDWRTGGDYYGWAPLGPGISLDISLGGSYYAPENYYTFVPRQYICAPNINNYYLPASRNNFILRNTIVINNSFYQQNRRYVSGPRPDDIRRYTNRPVNIYNINNSGRPGNTKINNNTLNIYRPAVRAGGQYNGGTPRPNQNFNGGGAMNSRNRAFDPKTQGSSFGSRAGSFDQGDNRRGSTQRSGNYITPQNSPSRNTDANRNQNNYGNRRNSNSINNNEQGNSQPRMPAAVDHPDVDRQADNEQSRNQNNRQQGSWRQSADFDRNRTVQLQMRQQDQQQQNQHQQQMEQQREQQNQQQQNQQNQQREQQQQQQQQNPQRQMQQRPGREGRPQRVD